ncbi:MAG: hypothetical protein RL477_1907, partial [Pseudomonadota bacterium]
IGKVHRRPLVDRLMRALLAAVLTVPSRLRAAAALGRAFAFAAPLLPRRFAAALRLAARLPRGRAGAYAPPVAGAKRGRVALLSGCVQDAAAPAINAALRRLLARGGMESVVLDAPCCGALDAHLGRKDAARDKARAVVAALARAEAGSRFDAVVQASSGCGSMLGDYAHLLAGDDEWAARARDFAALVRDPAEVLAGLDLPFDRGRALPKVVWQAPCSLANGQGVVAEPLDLLRRAGFDIAFPADGGRCCGAGGVYNALEPEMAEALARAKAGALGASGATVVVSANIGCMVQLGGQGALPVVHIAELLDWAAGGPEPAVLKDFAAGL